MYNFASAVYRSDICQHNDSTTLVNLCLIHEFILGRKAFSKRLKAMKMIQKQGNWVPHELKPRDVKRRCFACEQLFQR